MKKPVLLLFVIAAGLTACSESTQINTASKLVSNQNTPLPTPSPSPTPTPTNTPPPLVSGNLDTSFGAQGFFRPHGATAEIPVQIKKLADGKFLSLINEIESPTFRLVLYRLTSNGMVDSTFGVQGKIVVPFAPTTDGGIPFATRIDVQTNGKILIASATSGKWHVTRLLSNGDLDVGFGIAGHSTLTVPGATAFGGSVATFTLQSDGKIILTGNNGADFTIARISATGQLDTTFGTSGFTRVDFSNGVDFASRTHILSDGRMLVTGSNTVTIGQVSHVGLVRLNTNGTYDSSYGKKTFDLGYGYTTAGDSDLYSNGDLFVCANTSNGDQVEMGALRIKQDGTLDTTFGNQGKYQSNFAVLGVYGMSTRCMLHSDGKATFIGVSAIAISYFDESEISGTRITSSGQLDSTFATQGIFRTQVDLDIRNYAHDILMNGTNRMVILGSTGISGFGSSEAQAFVGQYVY